MHYEVSCGGIVYTRESGEPRYVIICSLSGEYGFPKGHMEGSETETETALREIREEVGLVPQIIPGFRLVTEYPLPSKRDVIKRVVLFAAEYENQTILPQKEELQNASLMSYQQAMATLTFDNNKALLTEAHQFITGRT